MNHVPKYPEGQLGEEDCLVEPVFIVISNPAHEMGVDKIHFDGQDD